MKNNFNIETPFYIVYEEKLRHNLNIIKKISEETGIKIIMAFKANALWKTFPIIKEYVESSTASSVNEMKLSHDFLGHDVHVYAPVYKENEFQEFLKGASHITFNSLNQFHKFFPIVKHFNKENNKKVSLGLRINPGFSVVETDKYNPCIPGSRFGMKNMDIPDQLPDGLDGFHFHALCESTSFDLESLLKKVERKFGKWLPKLKWLNMGGGHLLTSKEYDVNHLIEILKEFQRKFPNLKLIMEPGSAFTWQTGDLITEVLDIVEDSGIKTAIIDASFACHMPDCLEMPYKPKIKEAVDYLSDTHSYRLGGNTCLSGDFVGDWNFAKPLKPGDQLTLLDMNHYTTVKTNMFNGVKHPSIWLQPSKGEPILLRDFSYEDYRDRMD